MTAELFKPSNKTKGYYPFGHYSSRLDMIQDGAEKTYSHETARRKLVWLNN
jgi:hypothetical protein